MAGFTFKPMGDITFPIVNENDEMIKTYTIKTGTEDFLKVVTDKSAAILEGASSYKSEALMSAMKDFIDLVFGAGEFEFLFNAFNKNPFAMLALVAEVSKLGKSELEKKMKAYV